MKVVAFLASLTICLTCCHGAAEPVKTPAENSRWRVSDQQIMLNGRPFFVKGVNYSPTPVGGSFNWSPFGDWFTARWHDIYDRDLPKLRELGANSIRVYAWFAIEPTNEHYSRVEELDFKGPSVLDHTDFLNKAWNAGKDPVYVMITIPVDRPRVFYTGRSTSRKRDSERVYQFYKRTTAWAAEKYGRHPAVMGFCIGNECNEDPKAPSHDLFWERLNDLAQTAKAAAPEKLVTTAWYPHDPRHFEKYPLLLRNEHLDVISINFYDDGPEYAPYWDMIKPLMLDKGYIKPVLITEFGAPASFHDSRGRSVETQESNDRQAQWIATSWKSIMDHAVPNGPLGPICSGGYVFSWSDEWWKTDDKYGRAAVQDTSTIKKRFLPSGWLDEEWFGLNSVKPDAGRPPLKPWDPAKKSDPYPPDILTPRKAYHTIKSLWK
ncbi:MAG: hypothetical protein AB1646_00430 [Thermodesulfobacteriota bacterium]